MLRSFRLGNHRSFRDEQELLLMPSMPGDERPVVPVAAIYGANASGKSNLVDGLEFMRSAVLSSFRRDDSGRLERSPFRPLPGAAVPSVFVAELVAENVRYTYGFVLDEDTVREEWLYSFPEKRRRVIFEREGDETRFGSTVADLRAKLAVLEELIRPDALLLGSCDRLELGPLMPVYRWFEACLTLRALGSGSPPGLVAHNVGHYLHHRPDNARRLVALLAAADVGITDVVAEEVEGHIPGLPRTITAVAREIARRGAPPSRHWKLALTHGAGGGPFDLDDESAGTRNWLELLPSVLDSLDHGQVLVVDEIDASLHPLLTARLVGLFQDPEVNSANAQLVFTTHDTSLLGTMLGDQVLDRDQIWFVDKGADGVSELYPLTDFKPRKDQNTERRYLAGSYGAVPVLGGTSFSDAVLGR
ncbi:AAA family ATPase [Amycolatopsis sp. CA-230715]|uniref:AAA family ATPase n=1 Tax=Amycolatopsis sp. CA-230715 TaxID=2745196 RepID=UPI001C02ED84|nr:ATP-binding protein [Amycolatopsis sp. CA-230715]QWF77062.1 hypothetical protein HUW46_00442 [Amycolatopsis sp. CA-230715]